MAAGSQSFDDELVELFENSQDAFCIAGFDGYLKRANPAFPRSLGYTLDELLASPFVDNIYPGDRESVEAVLGELAAGKPVVGFECRHVRADGSVRWFDGIGGATAGKGSGLIGLVDRVEALGGKMAIQSPAGSGTSLLVDIPLDTT